MCLFFNYTACRKKRLPSLRVVVLKHKISHLLVCINDVRVVQGVCVKVRGITNI